MNRCCPPTGGGSDGGAESFLHRRQMQLALAVEANPTNVGCHRGSTSSQCGSHLAQAPGGPHRAPLCHTWGSHMTGLPSAILECCME